jgi:hypothetical protein
LGDRAIAEKSGIGRANVSRARKKTTVSNETVEKRTGKDGRPRELPQPRSMVLHQGGLGALVRCDRPVPLISCGGF